MYFLMWLVSNTKPPSSLKAFNKSWYLIVFSVGHRGLVQLKKKRKALCPTQWPLWTVGGREPVPGPQQPLPHFQQLLPLGDRRLPDPGAGGVAVRLKGAGAGRDGRWPPNFDPLTLTWDLTPFIHRADLLLPRRRRETQTLAHFTVTSSAAESDWWAAASACVSEGRSEHKPGCRVGAPLVGTSEPAGALWKCRTASQCHPVSPCASSACSHY